MAGISLATYLNGITKNLTWLKHLYPGYFAFVMATGIISIASYMLGMTWLAMQLFLINKVAFLVLWVLILVRLFFYSGDMISDLTDHSRGPGFFTMVAGTCIFGNQFVILAGDFTTATLLLLAGTLLWLILIYAFFTAVIVRESKPGLEEGVHGGWFIAVVATQSISVLGAQVFSKFTAHQDTILFFALALYLLGAMLYMLIVSLVFYRLAFFRLTPVEFIPLYWVNMGAAAITTLAGARLIIASAQWPFLNDILPFLKGFTLFFWATATWWIPLLLILTAWRHLYRRLPLVYDPQYWSLVFPLGMYTASTLVFARATGLVFLYPVSHYFVYIALFAWAVTLIGLIHRIVRNLRISL
ncbi:Voltage-dependent anion channel [uncultured archaeon]|nr:Voltage-dependent anion channel [uncultured archaeon]